MPAQGLNEWRLSCARTALASRRPNSRTTRKVLWRVRIFVLQPGRLDAFRGSRSPVPPIDTVQTNVATIRTKSGASGHRQGRALGLV